MNSKSNWKYVKIDRHEVKAGLIKKFISLGHTRKVAIQKAKAAMK